MTKRTDRWEAEVREIDEELQQLDTDSEFTLDTYDTTGLSLGTRAMKIFTLSKAKSTLDVSEKAVSEFRVSVPNSSEAEWSEDNMNKQTKDLD